MTDCFSMKCILFHKFNMLQSFFFFIICAILVRPFQCYHHYRSKHHRRQSEPMFQNPQQMPPAPQLMPQDPQQMPKAPQQIAQAPQQMPQAPQQMLQAPQQIAQSPQQMSQASQQMSNRFNSLQQPNVQNPVSYPMYPSTYSLKRVPFGNARLPYRYPHMPFAIPPGNVQAPFNNAVPSFGNNAMPFNNAVMHPASVQIPANQNVRFSNKEHPSFENAALEDNMDNFSPITESSLSPVFSPTPTDETQTDFADYGSPNADYSELSLTSFYSPLNPVNAGSRRRKKNVGENTDDLMNFFDKGKKLLEISTVSVVSNDTDFVNLDNNSVENNIVDDNITLIPLSKGIQLKTATKSGHSIIHAAVNISSSTQKIFTYDNNTEVENVVEMEMEKKIEDEKGADKGYEEVKIVETERVKPMFKSKHPNSRRRKKKSHKNRLFTHHRSKRSKISSEENPRSRFLYNKMAHRFLSAVKRKERVVELNNARNHHIIADFSKIKQRVTTDDTKQTKDYSVHDKKEIDDFMKFFLDEMKKFRKSQENENNIKESLNETCNECISFKPLPHKTVKKNLPYPVHVKHMNVIMNLNMTWDAKMKDHVAKSVRISKEYKTSAVRLEDTTISSAELSSQQQAMVPIPINENQNSRFFTLVVLFSALTSLSTISALILPKLCKSIRLNRMNAAMKSYKLYDDYPKNGAKEIENENLLSEDNQELEWQSENGDWLSIKESEFK